MTSTGSGLTLPWKPLQKSMLSKTWSKKRLSAEKLSCLWIYMVTRDKRTYSYMAVLDNRMALTPKERWTLTPSFKILKAPKQPKVLSFQVESSAMALPIWACNAWLRKRKLFHGSSIKIVMILVFIAACLEYIKAKNRLAEWLSGKNSIFRTPILWKALFVDRLMAIIKIVIFQWRIWLIWAEHLPKPF